MRLFRITLTIGALLSWTTARAGGAIFRYTEADGTIVYTNVVPRGMKSTKTVQRISGEFREAPTPASPAAVSTATRLSLSQFDAQIELAAARYRIPANLVRAVMHAESAFDPSAVSRLGASGLMQLMPDTARSMFVSDIFDAESNIEGGVRYLRVLANAFGGDMVKVVAAYNAGPDAVVKFQGEVPPYSETQAYVRKVLKLYYEYKAQADALAQAP